MLEILFCLFDGGFGKGGPVTDAGHTKNLFGPKNFHM